MVSLQKLITFKAKIVNIQPNQKQQRILLLIVSCAKHVSWPCGSWKIIPSWGDDIDKVKEGSTYQFRNLRVKQNKFTQETYIYPARQDSSISYFEEFTSEESLEK